MKTVDDDNPIWLFRGVPKESREFEDVNATGEVEPPRPDRTGASYRRRHSMNGDNETGYTSWTDDYSIACDVAQEISSSPNLSGEYVVFRVRFNSLDPDKIFEGRADEAEYLIEGTVENVEIADGHEDEVDE